MSVYRNIFGALTFLSLSCNGNEVISSDTAGQEKIIPYHVDAATKGTRKELFLGNLGKIMGLPQMSKASEKLHIRVWIWGGRKKYAVDIIDGSEKQCQIVEFNSKKLDTAEYIVVHKEWKRLQPSSGWTVFFEGLAKYQIPTLISGKRIEEYKDHLTEMAYVQFEIVQAGQYRFYEYLEPSYYRKIDSGSNNVNSFLHFLNQEMGVDIYKPAEHLYVRPDSKRHK